MHKIKNCRICGCKNLETFFDLGDQPLANGFVKDVGAENLRYPLSVSWCKECNLVQLNHTADPKELFSDYPWVTATSSTARIYAEIFCDTIMSHAGNLYDNDYLIEIASNDGTFLKQFMRRGCRVMGVDPAENIVKVAISEGISTKCGFFCKEMAQDILSKQGPAKIIVARNVLPHVANLHDFLEGIKIIMREDSLLAIEVHYAKIILEETHYDSIYHEHLCYFTLKSLQRLLNIYDLYIYDIMNSPISGGSIVAFIRTFDCEKGRTLLEGEKLEEKCRTNELTSWKYFAETSRKHRNLFFDLLDQELMQGRKVVGYGASARSTIMLNFSDIGNDRIKLIADKNPAKQKLFTPGNQIPVQSPETIFNCNPDTVVILAWNFLEEITNLLWNQFGFRGKLLIPLPNTPKLVSIREVFNG